MLIPIYNKVGNNQTQPPLVFSRYIGASFVLDKRQRVLDGKIHKTLRSSLSRFSTGKGRAKGSFFVIVLGLCKSCPWHH